MKNIITVNAVEAIAFNDDIAIVVEIDDVASFIFGF